MSYFTFLAWQNTAHLKQCRYDERSSLTFSDEDKDLLCQKLLFGGVSGGSSVIAELASAGLSSRDIQLKVLGPASVRLDYFWQQDRASFLDVRTATVRVENILREIAQKDLQITRGRLRQAVFANCPDEEHTIGVKMAADLQRAKGWHIHLAANCSYTELLSEISISPAEILGLSIGSNASLHRLFTLVRTLRLVRPELKILVSGAFIAENDRSMKLLGVDAYASSFEEAEVLLDKFVSDSAGRRQIA